MSDWAEPAVDSLAARAVSGIVLIAVGLGAALAGGAWLAAAAAAAIVAMSYEYARMSEPEAHVRAWAVAAVSGVAAAVAAALQRPEIGLAIMGLGAVVTALRRPGGLARRADAAFGVLYVGAPCMAFLWLRGGAHGVDVLLTLFAIIWSADIAAYFGGRFVGGPKLAPSLSPRKTWAGLIGGCLAGAIAAAVYALATGRAPGSFFVVGAALGLVGLGGDLFESVIKRRFGVKDASNLIPGHGGVMDRLDGLMAATLATACVAALWPGALAALMQEAS
jgi:phosphatidate cytidylyltransferase